MANPVLTRATFAQAKSAAGEAQMTLAGAITKTGALMALCGISAAGIWVTADSLGPSMGTSILVAVILGFILAMVTTFVPRWAPITAPLYAIAEGTLLGGITLIYNAQYKGLPLEALALTILAGGTMLALYVTRTVRVTQRFRAIMTGALLTIVLFYLASMVLSLFHVTVPFMAGGGWMSIGFSLLVCGIASLSFLLDFDMIEQAVDRGAPAYMEWYGAFGVLVTFVWLYLEMLRLLAELQGRRR